MDRREFLLTAGSAGMVVLSGCSGDDGLVDDQGNGNGGNGNGGNGNGNGDNGNGGSGNGNGSTGGGQSDVTYEESFVAEVIYDDPSTGEETTMVTRIRGENSYTRLEGQQTVEVYNVDGDLYQVFGGQCLKNPGDVEAPDSGPGAGPGEEWDPTVDIPDESDGRETVDGEEMIVYTLDPAEDALYEGDRVTVYVSAETGYLRRVETETGTISYHSWGEVDPIEPPDMDCQSVGGGGDNDY